MFIYENNYINCNYKMELNENDDTEDIGFVDEKNNFISNTKQKQSKLNEKKRNGQIQTLKPSTITQPTTTQKKKISYDDLLSNMGMKLINGKLELYNTTQSPYQNQQQQIYHQHEQQQQPYHQHEQQPQQSSMTKQQYKKYLALQYLKQQHERNRIGQIKSKKLLFSNPETVSNISYSPAMNQIFNLTR